MSEQRDITKLWMIPYADLMSLLMILFLGLFGFAYMDRKANYEKTVAQLQMQFLDTPQQRALAELKAKEAELARTLESNELDVKILADKIFLTFSSPILFDEGMAELKPEAQKMLANVAQALREIPNPAVVAGHTDTLPIAGGRFKTNWELSAARAYSVVDFLTRQGVAPARLSIFGYGEHRPIASNDTEEGRQRNRRIDISIMRQVENGSHAQ